MTGMWQSGDASSGGLLLQSLSSGRSLCACVQVEGTKADGDQEPARKQRAGEGSSPTAGVNYGE